MTNTRHFQGAVLPPDLSVVLRSTSSAGGVALPRALFWAAMLWLAVLRGSSVRGQGFSPEEAVGRMRVPPGLSVQLHACEPMVRQPILVKCDDRGRLWVIQYLQYPNPAGLNRVRVDRYSRTVYDRIPEPPPRGPRGQDRITILEDRDGDGRADAAKDFVNGLNLATGLAFGHGGVFVLQVPYLLFYPDRNRDDVPDSDPEVLLEGFGMEDAQSFANHLTWGPDGWLYGVNGSTTTCRIRGIEFQQGVWRYHPLSKEFELYCEGGGNLFGLTFDASGNLFYSSNGNYLFFHAMQGAYYPKNYGKHGPLHNLYAYGTLQNVQYQGKFLGPTTGGTIYTGDTFPPNMRHSFLAGNFLGHSASWWKVQPAASTVTAELSGTLLDAQDTWFGPTDLCQGPDGSVYICDFYDQRTAHPDPDAAWDRSNGRVYKIVADGTPPVRGLDLASRTSAELVELLRHPNGWYGDQARSLLAARRDEQVLPTLHRLAQETTDEGLALQYWWGLYVSGAWNEEVAARMLAHEAQYVRMWAVRWLGDDRHATPRLARQLVGLAQAESSPVVRAQLAASAKRLPAPIGLDIVFAMLDGSRDDHDPNIPWLLWWALEDKSLAATDTILAQLARPSVWTSPAWRRTIPLLTRRFAAAGIGPGYQACLQILQHAPADQLDSVLTGLSAGLDERARSLSTMEPGDLYRNLAPATEVTAGRVQPMEPLPAELRAALRDYWQSQPASELHLRLAMQADLTESQQYARSALQDSRTPESTRLMLLRLLAVYGNEQQVNVALSLIAPEQSDAVQTAALAFVGRFQDSRIADRLLRHYPRTATAVQSRIRDLMFARAAWAREFLAQVEQGRIDPSSVPLEQLRVIALHQDEELNAMVRKHWGTVRSGTPEEKLAEIRRLSNDLRAGAGDASRGKTLFQKHCGTCHRRNGEGGVVGPDLTAVSRDQAFLLVSLVDPSVVIRSQFTAYAVTTRSGQVMTGTLAEQDAASVRLLDAKGESTRILRDQIEEMAELSTSLMPDNLLQPLSVQELRDLFRYLMEAPGSGE